ncbi:MAG: helix-turn-helix transcriptional regulator [Bacteroides sp.]|nr:helix-turn-helix transcriptional regulator [Bacteroides sp.]
MYNEYPPDIRLQHLIETYWVTDGMIDTRFTQGIMPDGCVDIIFDFDHDNCIGLPQLVGTMTSPLEVTCQPGRVLMMGIRFAPGGITALTHIPVYEITNRIIELPLADMLFDSAFYISLPEITEMEKRITYINQYFIEQLHKLYLPDRQIGFAVSVIRKNNGQLSVRKLAEEVCLCERHFERKFKAAIGTTPKMFSNVMRFQFARRYLKMHTEENLFSVSLACGYHDLSHMNKEFRSLGKISPSDV